VISMLTLKEGMRASLHFYEKGGSFKKGWTYAVVAGTQGQVSWAKIA